MEVHSILLLFLGVFSSAIGSTVKLTVELGLEEMVRQLSAKVEEMESEKRESRAWRNYLSEKLEELEKRTLEKADEVIKRITEVEMRSAQTMTKFAEELQSAESRFKKVDNHILLEVLQLKSMLKGTAEKVRTVEEQVERQRQKTHSLQVQMIELNSELHSVDIIRKNTSSMADNLGLKLDEGLSNLTRNMRIYQNSTLNFLKDCANSSYVSKLEENLKTLEKNSKNELVTLQSELSPRLEKLEGSCVHCDDVPEIKQTLTIHSSLLGRLNRHLWEVETLGTCAGEPPSIRNGKPLKFVRKHRSAVHYECDQDFVVTGNSTVHCDYGKWEGHPPICSFFDTTFTLVSATAQQNGFTCYSDRYSQNIKFSRVVDTGMGGGLPTGGLQEGSFLNFTQTAPSEAAGAYECRFHVDNRSAGIVVPFDTYGELRFERQSEVATVGKTVKLEVRILSIAEESKLRWRHNGVLVPSWGGRTEVEISGVQPADAGIYECYQEGHRSTDQTIFRLVVRKCETNRYGGNCEHECPVCYNGGICHDLLGVCICPVGFSGKNCEPACKENHVIGKCVIECPTHLCAYRVFCKPDPYGCSCFPGFQGIWCDTKCDPGYYGAGCKQPCHCDGDCDRFTGACSGACSPGWAGPSCQIEVVN